MRACARVETKKAKVFFHGRFSPLTERAVRAGEAVAEGTVEALLAEAGALVEVSAAAQTNGAEGGASRRVSSAK